MRTFPWVFMACCLLCVGCQGASSATTAVITPAQMAAVTITLSDLPTNYRLATDLTPTNDQLAQFLGQSSLATTLAQWNRTGGSLRVFTFTAPEPSIYNATVRATVEVDLFDTSQHAAAWEAARQTLLPPPGNALNVAAPGQVHQVFAQMYHAGDITATTTTLTFAQSNVAVAITTQFVGAGASLADAERFAALIQGRLTHPTAP
jgi:hypothetical protein